MEWGVKNWNIRKNDILSVTILFFINLISVEELIWCANYPNVHIHIFGKRWSFIWGYFFPVSILKSHYWEKLALSKLRFSKLSKFISRSVFGELQLMQISPNFKTCCNVKIKGLGEKCVWLFYCFKGYAKPLYEPLWPTVTHNDS